MKDEILLPKERERIIKKKLYIKFFIFIVINNLFISLYIDLPDKMEDPTDQSLPLLNSKKYVLITLPVRLFLPLHRDSKRTEASIFDQKKQLLIKKVYIRPLSKYNNKKRSSAFSENITMVDLEIRKQDLSKLVKSHDPYLLIYPYLSNIVQRKILKKYNYEITF